MLVRSENHRQGDGCWDAAQNELAARPSDDLTGLDVEDLVTAMSAAYSLNG